MKKIVTTTLICLSITLPAVAMSSTYNDSDNWWSPSRLYMGAYGGYGNVSGAYKNDGQVTQGRFVLGLHAGENHSASIGAELGVESGNDMRLQANAALIEAAGGLPLQSTLKPLMDLLITLEAPFSSNYPVIGILKGGIAYRQLQLNDRNSSRDELKKINPELQVGLGVTITNNTMLTAVYQGIYSGSTSSPALNSVGDVTISHIPTQQAVFLGVEYSFGGQTPSTPVIMPEKHAHAAVTYAPKHTAENRAVKVYGVEPVKTAENSLSHNVDSNIVKITHTAYTAENHNLVKADAKQAVPKHLTAKEITKALAANKISSKTTTETSVKKVAQKTEAKTSHKKAAAITAVKKSSHEKTLASKATSKPAHAAKIAAKKVEPKKLASTKVKAAKPVLHAKNKTAVKTLAHQSAEKKVATKPEVKQELAQVDNLIIDKPSLDLSLMGDTTVNEAEKTQQHDNKEVMI